MPSEGRVGPPPPGCDSGASGRRNRCIGRRPRCDRDNRERRQLKKWVKCGYFLSRTQFVGRGPSGRTFAPTPICRRSRMADAMWTVRAAPFQVLTIDRRASRLELPARAPVGAPLDSALHVCSVVNNQTLVSMAPPSPVGRWRSSSGTLRRRCGSAGAASTVFFVPAFRVAPRRGAVSAPRGCHGTTGAAAGPLSSEKPAGWTGGNPVQDFVPAQGLNKRFLVTIPSRCTVPVASGNARQITRRY